MKEKILGSIISICIPILLFLLIPSHHIVRAQNPTPAQIELACPAGSNPISPIGTVIDQSQPTANQRQWLCVDFFGNTFIQGGIVNACKLGGILTIDIANTCNWSGSDTCAKINTAYASLPAQGGKISVSPGIYTCSTAIVFTTSSKPVTLTCPEGVPGNFPTTAPALIHYTGTGAFITLSSQSYFTKVQGCVFTGPDGVTTTTASGITVGGTNISSVTTIDHVDISGFGNGGLVFGNNAYVFKCDTCSIHDNGPSGGKNVVIPSGLTNFGENISFLNGSLYNISPTAISATCVNIQTGADLGFNNVSFDNCLMTINNSTGTAAVSLYGSTHFETNISNTTDFITIGTSANFDSITISGVTFREDNSSARTEFIIDNATAANHSLQLNINGLIVVSGETVANFATIGAGSACCAQVSIQGLQNFNGSLTNLVNSSTGSANLFLSPVDNTGNIVLGNSGKPIKIGPGTVNTTAVTLAINNQSGIPILGTLTTTAAASDNVTINGMTASGHCSLTATNASAATNIATTFVSAKTTNQITVSHTATASMTYDIACTPN